MNIYLTSYGIDTRYDQYMNSYDEIISLLKDKKVVIIPNAKLLSESEQYNLFAFVFILRIYL